MQLPLLTIAQRVQRAHDAAIFTVAADIDYI
jgi:hypothetical protein